MHYEEIPIQRCCTVAKQNNTRTPLYIKRSPFCAARFILDIILPITKPAVRTLYLFIGRCYSRRSAADEAWAYAAYSGKKCHASALRGGTECGPTFTIGNPRIPFRLGSLFSALALVLRFRAGRPPLGIVSAQLSGGWKPSPAPHSALLCQYSASSGLRFIW